MAQEALKQGEGEKERWNMVSDTARRWLTQIFLNSGNDFVSYFKSENILDILNQVSI